MRVCRFGFDEMVLTGFYTDSHVIPIDQAAEAYSRDNDVELLLPSTEDPWTCCRPTGSRTSPPASSSPGSKGSTTRIATS